MDRGNYVLTGALYIRFDGKKKGFVIDAVNNLHNLNHFHCVIRDKEYKEDVSELVIMPTGVSGCFEDIFVELTLLTLIIRDNGGDTGHDGSIELNRGRVIGALNTPEQATAIYVLEQVGEIGINLTPCVRPLPRVNWE